MSHTPGTTLCPRCGAPVPWDGVAKNITCPFCHVISQPNAPPARIAAMQQSKSGGMGMGCVIFAIVGVLGVLFVAAGVFFFAMRSTSSATSGPVIITTSTPAIVTATPMATAKTAALRTFGETGNGAGQLTDARSLAVDMDENIYTADYSSLRVQKFDATGKFQWIIQVPKDAFAGNTSIFGMAVDSKNVLWVCRTGDLLKYATADGKAVGVVKGNYDTMWFHWIAIDPVGNIATTHSAAGDNDLLLLDPNGKLKKRIKNKEPNGIAVDGAGNVYLSEDSAIEVLDATGAVKSRFGSKTDKHTKNASALAVDGKGHIFAETSEGLDVFDQGGGFIKTFDTSIHATRSFAITSKNHIVVLGGDKISVFDIGSF